MNIKIIKDTQYVHIYYKGALIATVTIGEWSFALANPTIIAEIGK